MKLKSFGLVLSLLSDHVQGNIVEKDFQILLDIGIMARVFANGSADLGSIPGWVVPKTQKMVIDATLLNTQHYKVTIKGKVEQSRERSSALPYTLFT